MPRLDGTGSARELTDEFPDARSLVRECRVIGNGCMILVGHRRIASLAGEDDAFSDEDDASSSGTAYRDGRPVPLQTHLHGVEALARQHAVGCGLPDSLVEAIARAGLLHDIAIAWEQDPR